MLAVANPRAGGGRAARALPCTAASLRRELGEFDLREPSDAVVTREVVRSALSRGERRFLALGGDGTVNALVSILADAATPAVLREIRIGAVALGSSNDFHKPKRPGREPGRRLDFSRAILTDLGRLDGIDEEGRPFRQWFVLNASIGVTAEANLRYNHGAGLLGWLKRHSPMRGIPFAALSTILAARPLGIRLTVDGRVQSGRVWNLAVVKSPHFTGSLHYDSPLEPASGRFHVHGIADVSRRRLLWIALRLARGRFSGLEGTFSLPARYVAVEADEPFAVEADGEVRQAVRAEMRVVPRAVGLCP